jgi:cobalt-zinc-cadmium efflux system outer membrane protein
MSFITRFSASRTAGRWSPRRLTNRRLSSGIAVARRVVLPSLVLLSSPMRLRAQHDAAHDTVNGRAVATGSGPNVVAALGATDARSEAELDSLVATALTRSPAIRAAMARVEGARHRAIAAGAPPDPMLMAGLQNQPLGKDRTAMTAGPDPMTMRMVGVSQSIPSPGKLALRRRAAEREVDAGEAAAESARRLVARDVKQAYYELAFIEQAREIVERNRDVLATVVRVTDARYGLGTAGQTEVLKARLDGARLAQSASELAERRNAALARLAALLDGMVDSTALRPVIPARIARLVLPASSEEIRFTSNVLGSRAAGSPLPSLSDLQNTALANSPEIREHEAMIAAQAVRVELARRDRRPDIDVALQYGQRIGGLPDMVSASVSVPLPIFARRKQDQLTADASVQLEALHAEHEARANALRAEVASLVSDIERARTQLALYAKALVPQGRAMLTSATSSYQVGKGTLRDVLDAQASLFTYETDDARALTDFAKQMAELERVVGKEIVR